MARLDKTGLWAGQLRVLPQDPVLEGVDADAARPAVIAR
jgi:hypothetical protein